MPLNHYSQYFSDSDSDSLDSDTLIFNRPIEIVSDFDGTMFMQDTGHVLVDSHGCGMESRKKLTDAIEEGEVSFKKGSEEMWSTLHISPKEAAEVLGNTMIIDEKFEQFFEFTQRKNINFTVISAGLKPILRTVLDEFLGKEDSAKIDIISNDAKVHSNGEVWTPVWIHNDTELGHDKSRSMSAFKERVAKKYPLEPLVIMIGDGISDIPVANHSDILFARRGESLERYCLKNNLPYIGYDNFEEIQKVITPLLEGNSFHKEKQNRSTWLRPELEHSQSDFSNENKITGQLQPTFLRLA